MRNKLRGALVALILLLALFAIVGSISALVLYYKGREHEGHVLSFLASTSGVTVYGIELANRKLKLDLTFHFNRSGRASVPRADGGGTSLTEDEPGQRRDEDA